MDQLEQFGARIFFFPNGDILVKQTALQSCLYRCTGKQCSVKAGPDQPARLMDCLRLARFGKLGKQAVAESH